MILTKLSDLVKASSEPYGWVEMFQSLKDLPPTPYEILQIRIMDALLQFEDGRWASTPQDRIPMAVVRAALVAYDPTKPLRIVSEASRSQRDSRRLNAGDDPAPICPHCHRRALRYGRKYPRRRWKCYGCGQFVTQEPKEAIAC